MKIEELAENVGEEERELVNALLEESVDVKVTDDTFKKGKIKRATQEERKKLNASEYVYTDDEDEELVITAAGRATIEYKTLAQSKLAQRILRGKITGSKISEDGNTMLVKVDYVAETNKVNYFSIYIPTEHLFDEVYDPKAKKCYEGHNSYRIKEDRGIIQHEVNKRLGSWVDFIVYEVVEKNRLAIASRLRAMSVKGWENFIEKKRDGEPRIGSECLFKTTVTAVGDSYVMVEGLGAECVIPVHEISYQKITSARDLYAVGESVIVRVLSVKRVDRILQDSKLALVKVEASIKQVDENPQKVFYEEFVIGGHYPGVVTQVTDHGVFVNLQNKVDVHCKFPDGQMPYKEQGAVIRITEKTDETYFIKGVFVHLN